MADFEQIKTELQQKKAAAQQAARQQERQRSLQGQIDQLKRSANADNPQVLEAIKELEAKARKAGAAEGTARENFLAGKERLAGLWQEILPLTDPREMIGQWDDDIPILLFPLRLETRFKKVKGRDGSTHDELWVRVYPDDCLVDTFEEDLTDMERQNARRYWAFHWAAAGDETKERQAWRELVASHGSGRAGWILQHYQPSNLPEKPPVPSPPGDFHLVIPAQEAEPMGADAIAVANFWKNVFLKNDNLLNASDLAKKYKPVNLNSTAPDGANVQVVFVRFPAFGEEDSRPFSWSEAPKVKLLPERFVFLGYNTNGDALRLVKSDITQRPVQAPLAVGPNPSATEAEQFQQTEDGDLIVPEEMRWMTDFEEALAKGMGFRIPLDATLAKQGFERVLVLGVRLGSDHLEAKEELEELLRHHLYGRSGFSIIPQGTPTNNTEDGPSGYSRTDDPDESFPVFVKQENLFEPTIDPSLKTDGQWLAEWLGIDLGLLQRTPNGEQTDRAEAKAMNMALWPATMGYWMQKMMSPVFQDSRTVAKTKQFFTEYVSGRGHIPSVRVGKQPYGILQASAYRNAEWLPQPPATSVAVIGFDNFLPRLYKLLMDLDPFWKQMAKAVPHVGNGSLNPQQQLLDIVALAPSSVEYHARYGHSALYLFNYFVFSGLPFSLWSKILEVDLPAAARELLANLGYTGTVEPKIFEKYYRDGQHRLNGPIVDDRPLSESDLIRNYSENDRNYIGWLIEALGDYTGMLLPQKKLKERPQALLYLLLRHALLEEYDNAGHKARLNANLLAEPAFNVALAVEPEFIHVQSSNTVSESRIAHLLEPVPAITGNQEPLVKSLGFDVKKPTPAFAAVRDLKHMEKALGLLEKLPTARLERLLAEHVDCCTYRHDAWVQGLLNWQLEQLRSTGEGETRQGIFLGAYAWLENLRPEGKVMQPAQLPDELSEIFQRKEDTPLTTDSKNQGYIHAPSLNHAVTAAVLRNGYLSNATPTQPGLLAVNLSSERVRLAMDTLEGIRNGQSLGALLGYRFERKLHDRDPAMFVFSYQLRKAFPLVANRLQNTKDTDEESQEAIAARNVVDGYAMLKKALGTTNKLNFAFLTPLLTDPAPSAVQRKFIEETITDLQDIHDAMSDLGIAESVHQIVQGNYDRAASTLDAFSNATFPQTPDVAVTPRSGTTLTHRVALHFDGQAMPNPAHTPRGQSEPALNQWLASILPAANAIATAVSYTNPGDPAPAAMTEKVTLQDLGLQPLDLLYLFHFDADRALGSLDERILRVLFKKPAVHANAKVEIKYTVPLADATVKATFFEIASLLRSLRSMVLTSRPLRPTDAAPPNEANPDHEPALVLARSRIDQVLPNPAELDALLAAWAVLPNVDQQLNEFVDVFAKFGLYGMTEAGFGFAYDRRQALYVGILQKIETRMETWASRLSDFKKMMTLDLPAAATDEEKAEILRKAEALVSTEFVPEPPTIGQFQADVAQKGVDFDAKKTALEGIRKNPPATLHQLLTDLNSQLPLTDFDGEAFDLTAQEDEVARFQQELLDKTTALKLEVEARLAKVTAQLAVHDAPDSPPDKKLAALQAAGKVLFGEEFLMVPNFQLTDSQGFEWQNALDGQAETLAFSKKTDLFPVDTWFHGVARVREKVHHLENACLLTEAFGKTMQDLLPTQFPFRKWEPDPVTAPGVEEAEPWLALAYPSEFDLQEEKVLYTAAYAPAFNRTAPQCGLLLDEWTEVIPSREETTGVTFHYDRPNTEPPQAWLLATPSLDHGEWVWDDLVAALHQTLDLAKQRAVEPAQVEKTALGVFSPATVFPVTPRGINPSLNLNFVNMKLASF